MTRSLRWVLAVVVGFVVATGFSPGSASAHVEVTADNPQAGAANVTVTFTGEAESSTAGIASERVYLPAGITPQQVRLSQAPAGWTFTAEADGFTVAGAPLPIGTDAEFSVVIAQLPVATELIFKTVETYGDGEIARWITEPQPGQPAPDMPAPVLTLSPAAPGATSTEPSSAPSSANPQPSAVTAEATTAPAAGRGSSGWWIGLIVVVAGVAAGLIYLRRRRNQPPPPPASGSGPR